MMQARTTNPKRTTPPFSQAQDDLPASVAGPRLMVVVSTVLLVVLGFVMVYSASSITAIDAGLDPFADMGKQISYAIVGVFFCAALARFIPYRAWQGWLALAAFGLSLGLLLLTAAIGTVGLGAQRWLTLGPINLQPSEFAKIGVLLFMAKLLHDYQEGDLAFKPFMIAFGALNITIVLLVLFAQSDLGTSLICFLGIAAMLWLSEVPTRWVAAYGACVVGMGALALTVGYRWERLMNFTHPWDDPYGTGYQLIHSLYAFAQGGVFGVGLGNSAEKYLYLPEAETDFIFSIIGEELGLIGATGVIVLFMALLMGGLLMARSAPDRFGTALCGSFAIIIVFQAFLNIACVIGLFPITGKPLPFISSGGSSLIASLIMVGLMLSVSHASDEPAIHRQRRDDLRVIPGGRQAFNGNRQAVAAGGRSSARRGRADARRGGGRAAAGLSRALPAARATGGGGRQVRRLDLAGASYRQGKGRR